MAAAEETFFACFKQADNTYHGTYKNALLRAVMEATMSAPTYFYPLERFVDGGTTTYNNPSLAAFIEAVSYSRPKDKQSNYRLSELTLFSFGTGISRQFIKPDDTINPKGVDINFWLNWLMTQTPQDASAMQTDMFRSPMMNTLVDFRRFQITLDPIAIKKLPNIDALDGKKIQKQMAARPWRRHPWQNIDMADVTRFDLMKVIGAQMAEYITQTGNNFRADLIDRNRGSF